MGWLLLSVVAAFVCHATAPRRGLPAGAFALLAVLVGPGALAITRRAKVCPQLPQCVAVVAALGGLVNAFFLMSHSVLEVQQAIFEGMSLSLPTPTVTLLELTRLGNSVYFGCWWALLGWTLLTGGYQLLERWLGCEAQDDAELAAKILQNWVYLFPLAALVGACFTFLALALMFPFHQLVGWVGG